MKLRSTTPASINLPGKIILASLAILIAVAVPIQIMTRTVSADEYDDKINALQNEISQFKAESDRLNSEAATLQNALAIINNEKTAIQTQIDLSQAKHDKLVSDIAATEKKIVDNQDALGTTIANLYVDDKISPIEMIASSSNISEFMDKQEYRNSVRDELTITISKIKELKKALDTQKVAVGKVLEEQKGQREVLAAKESEQQSLLSKTRGDEAAYQGMIKGNESQIAEARALQAALRSRSSSTGGSRVVNGNLLANYITDSKFGSWTDKNCPMAGWYSTGGVDYPYGGYPANYGQDGRGYGCRQCASYVAWKINQVKGYWPSWGNASSFGSKGAPSAPKAGTVAVMYNDGPGHVAWVETDPYISTSGPLIGQRVIQVSQYNYDYGFGYGMYSLMELSVGFFDTYRQL